MGARLKHDQTQIFRRSINLQSFQPFCKKKKKNWVVVELQLWLGLVKRQNLLNTWFRWDLIILLSYKMYDFWMRMSKPSKTVKWLRLTGSYTQTCTYKSKKGAFHCGLVLGRVVYSLGPKNTYGFLLKKETFSFLLVNCNISFLSYPCLYCLLRSTDPQNWIYLLFSVWFANKFQGIFLITAGFLIIWNIERSSREIQSAEAKIKGFLSSGIFL